MRVLINDRPLQQTLTGVGHYIAQLLTHVPTADAALDLQPFVFRHILRRDWRTALQRPPPPPPKPGTAQRDISKSRFPWWVRRGLQWGYGTAFRAFVRKYDIYHEPNHIPIATGRPTVTTIHDLSGLLHPQWHPADRVKWYEREFPEGVKRTTRFLTASAFTKRQVVSELGVAPEHIFVSYQAPRAAFVERGAEEVAALRNRLELPEQFFLYVGTLEPRKNVPGLLDAYRRLPEAVQRRAPLLVVGAWGWKQQQLREKLAERHLENRVRLMGFLQDEELAGLYAACTAFVWPTFFEGFGLPPLEAMACGAPVIVSDVASLPEVVGEAGVRLRPDDVEAWTVAMTDALGADEQARSAQRSASLGQAARFTWEKFAQVTLAAYQAALSQPTQG